MILRPRAPSRKYNQENISEDGSDHNDSCQEKQIKKRKTQEVIPGGRGELPVNAESTVIDLSNISKSKLTNSPITLQLPKTVVQKVIQLPTLTIPEGGEIVVQEIGYDENNLEEIDEGNIGIVVDDDNEDEAVPSSIQSNKEKLTPGRKICETTACKNYCLTKLDLVEVECVEKENTHNSYSMSRWYGKNFVHALALKKYGSEEGIQEALMKRKQRGETMIASQKANAQVKQAREDKERAELLQKRREQQTSRVSSTSSSINSNINCNPVSKVAITNRVPAAIFVVPKPVVFVGCVKCKSQAAAGQCTVTMCGACCKQARGLTPCSRHNRAK